MTGKELKDNRQRLGLTQKELGEALGYTENYIWMLENDRAPIPNNRRMILLLSALSLEKREEKRK